MTRPQRREPAEKPSIIFGQTLDRNPPVTIPTDAAPAPLATTIVSDGLQGGSFLAVIDTQSLLDWKYFGNEICSGWPLPGEGSWRWLATAAMRDELSHVLARGFGERWQTPARQVLDFFDRHATVVADKALPAGLARALRCTDPDDQKFVDLAISARAQWLVSRDRAVLKLRRRAWTLSGVKIVAPADWRPTASGM
ncbi:PIN domain-containing protein [Ideonella sp. YS5]|uniref:PIN domain-containing protein n=1 Tax=Ideonella sp. YS5 TaxID=3453714 RepID=UPI003EE8C12E